MRDEIKASIEAILFVNGEKLQKEELMEFLNIGEIDLKEIMQELIEEYRDARRGIQVLAIDDGYIMCTKPEYSSVLNKLIKPVNRRLSAAAMEALTIIAYRQPITKAEIEQIRGVKTDRIINNLVEKGIIKEEGKKDGPGRATLYVTTHEFLKIFSLSSLNDLPNLEEFE